MPKVGELSYKLKGSDNKRIILIVNLVNKTKQFQCALPSDWAEIVFGTERFDDNVSAPDYASLELKVNALFRKYGEAVTTEVKVIMYKFFARNKYQSFHGSTGFNLGFAGSGVMLDYVVKYKVCTGSSVIYTDSTFTETNHSINTGFRKEDWKEIPYTIETEKFFESLLASMDAMVNKAKKFFDGTPEMLLVKIADGGGQKLLM